MRKQVSLFIDKADVEATRCARCGATVSLMSLIVTKSGKEWKNTSMLIEQVTPHEFNGVMNAQPHLCNPRNVVEFAKSTKGAAQ